jgi:hypothetical protein
MTVCRETSYQKFNGQDGEQMDITEASEGATFHAVDTGRKYIYHNGGWAEDLRDIYVAEHI